MRGALLAGVAALLSACASTQEDRRPTSAADIGIATPPGASEWLVGHYTERVLMFHDVYAAPMNGGVAFVGDSITEMGDWARLFPGVETRNYGIGGDTTLGLENRLDQVIAARPAVVMLLIGANDIGNDHRSVDDVIANYGRVIYRLMRGLPEADIYVQSVLPREAQHAQTVRELNERLHLLTLERWVRFVDIYTPFAVDGALDASVTEDQLHLNEAGYQRWREIIAPIVMRAH